MVNYRRSRVAGGTFFFTVNLRDRRRALLCEHIDALREIVRGVRAALPFVINAMAVLPDHWHAVWTLPPDDADYARRMRLIKARFTRHLTGNGMAIAKDAEAITRCGKSASGSIRYVMTAILKHTSITCTSIP